MDYFISQIINNCIPERSDGTAVTSNLKDTNSFYNIRIIYDFLAYTIQCFLK